mgnify:CR=1 FL=1
MGRVPVQPPVDAAVVRGDVGDQALDAGLDGAHARCLEQGPPHTPSVCRVNDLQGDLGRRVVLAHPAHDAHRGAVLLCDEGDVSSRCDVA